MPLFRAQTRVTNQITQMATVSAKRPREGAADTAGITVLQKEYAKQRLTAYTSKATQTSRGCLIPDKVQRSDGYVRFSVPKMAIAKAYIDPDQVTGERTFYLHQLAWFASDKKMPVPVIEHLSHLCNDARCFNVAHLHVETPQDNNKRKKLPRHCEVSLPLQTHVLGLHAYSSVYPALICTRFVRLFTCSSLIKRNAPLN